MTIREFGEKISMAEEAIVQSEKHYEIFKNDDDYLKVIEAIKNDVPPMEVQEMNVKLSEKLGINNLELHLAVLLTCGDVVKENFEKQNYSDELCWESSVDIKCKANETKDLCGFYGVSPFFWGVRVLRGELVKLGRLEFEERESDFDFTVNGFSIKKGDIVLGMHIPTGGRMTPQEIDESFELAYNFYNKKYDGWMIVRCGSWIVYPPFQKLFKEGSNLWHFAKRFKMVHSIEDPEFKAAWRIFNTRDISNPDALPQDSSLRKAIAEYLKNGGIAGDGIGFTAYKPE